MGSCLGNCWGIPSERKRGIASERARASARERARASERERACERERARARARARDLIKSFSASTGGIEPVSVRCQDYASIAVTTRPRRRKFMHENSLEVLSYLLDQSNCMFKLIFYYCRSRSVACFRINSVAEYVLILSLIHI